MHEPSRTRRVRFLLRFLFLHLLLSCCALAQAAPAGRETLSLDRGWLFHLGDVVPAPIVNADETYGAAKAGAARGAAAARYDDSAWRKLDLPHDWAVEGPFDPKANVSQGYRPRGIAWYRRYLKLDQSERGRHVELQFDGIATHATVWVNGNVVHRNWSGYNASRIDVTPYLQYGEAGNTIAIRVDATAMEGWWYEGAGIYRHTWLIKSDPVRVVQDGLKAVPRQDRAGRWTIPVEVALDNDGKTADQVEVEVLVQDPDGKTVARKKVAVTVPVLAGGAVARLPVTVPQPALWSLARRQLYKVSASVRRGGSEIDSVALHTGLRTLRFDAAKGFFLNGEHVKLQGVCLHQDHAGVGVAVPDAIWEYRLRRLKEMGVNAIRFSHNAIAPEILDMADRMGFLVMAENRNFNPSPEYMRQLEWMVRRDRHHPAVILWSIFNEEPVQGTAAGYEMARRMAAAVRLLDDTRPVTAAMNGGFFSELNVSHAVDVLGANYQVRDYDRYHTAHPDQPFTSSEDTSAFMTRGEYITDPKRNVIASYDDDAAPWGNTHRDAWEAIGKRDYVAGGFVWTGFDYRGEPTPHTWPSVGSFFGIMDLCGFAKTAFYIHQVQWVRDRPLIHIAPHWNWAGKEGQPVRVMVMANTETVTLLLNGREIGTQKTDPWRMNRFEVPYAPGKLVAIGKSGGRETARAEVETTGPAVALELVPDRAGLTGDGRDAMPVTVRALDAQGRALPLADAPVTFAVRGAGRSIGHGNGDPNSHEDEKGATRHLFNGLAQLLVQSDAGASGALEIEASSPGLQAARLRIPVAAGETLKYAPVSDSAAVYLEDWRVAPAAGERPDPNQVLAGNDNNTWAPAHPPMRFGLADGGRWQLYRTVFAPRAGGARKRVRFEAIAGKAEVWIDGKLAGKKDKAERGGLSVNLPDAEGARQLTVLVQAEGDKPAGIDGSVWVEPVR